MHKDFGWAIIGCGAIARKVAKEILKSESGYIAAVWNRTKARADDFVKKFGGTVYGTPEQAIKGDRVKCVYVATTHDMHAHFSKLSVELGVPVLCEKPFTVNFAQADELVSLARTRGVYCAEAMWTWHDPISIKVKEWIRSGVIGDIKRLKCSLAYPLMETCNNPRLTSPELIGGALMDMGVYPVRYVYELFGMPKSITAHGKLIGGVDVDENIVMDYGDFTAELYVSVTKLRREKLTVEGSNGKITVPSFHSAHRARLDGSVCETANDKSLLYGLQFLHTAQDVEAGKTESGFVTLDSSLDVMRLLDECRRQMGVVYPCEKT